jgi:hypothetical protein
MPAWEDVLRIENWKASTTRKRGNLPKAKRSDATRRKTGQLYSGVPLPAPNIKSTLSRVR